MSKQHMNSIRCLFLISILGGSAICMALEDPIARQVRYLCGLPYLQAEEEDMLEEALEHWHLSRLADQEVRTLASGERFAPLSQGDAQSLLDARIHCRFHRKQALRLLRPICQAHGAMIGGWFSPFCSMGDTGRFNPFFDPLYCLLQKENIT